MQQRMDKYLDLDTNLKEREDLLKQAFWDGYWDDYKGGSQGIEAVGRPAQTASRPRMRFRNSRSRRESRCSPSDIQASPLIPNPESKSLTGETTNVMSLVKQKKASLVTFMFSAFGEGHVNSYTQRFLDEFKGVNDVQLVQMNVAENLLKAPVLRVLTRFVRRKVPKEPQANYLLHYKSIQESRRAAGMSNTVLGWVNLVDQERKSQVAGARTGKGPRTRLDDPFDETSSGNPLSPKWPPKPRQGRRSTQHTRRPLLSRKAGSITTAKQGKGRDVDTWVQ
ncbi:ATP10 protein-domain-containing protein [Powellomyces hirtus]|nr:ATP10 protein-domain-containing protein [Powellomyces hirtus]